MDHICKFFLLFAFTFYSSSLIIYQSWYQFYCHYCNGYAVEAQLFLINWYVSLLPKGLIPPIGFPSSVWIHCLQLNKNVQNWVQSTEDSESIGSGPYWFHNFKIIRLLITNFSAFIYLTGTDNSFQVHSPCFTSCHTPIMSITSHMGFMTRWNSCVNSILNRFKLSLMRQQTYTRLGVKLLNGLCLWHVMKK